MSAVARRYTILVVPWSCLCFPVSLLVNPNHSASPVKSRKNIMSMWYYATIPSPCHLNLPPPKLTLLSSQLPPTMPAISLTAAFDVLVLVSFFAAFSAIRDYQRRRGLPYPPGPRPLPLIGNLFDIRKEFSWLSYTELSKKHGIIYFAAKELLIEYMTGNVLSFRVFGNVVVVLNSTKAAKDLLESRGDIYSGRPVSPITEM